MLKPLQNGDVGVWHDLRWRLPRAPQFYRICRQAFRVSDGVCRTLWQGGAERFEMFEFLRQNQLDIMLMMSSVCAAIAFFIAISKTVSPERKKALFLLELSSTALLLADRYAFIFDGVSGQMAFWVVRLSNFEVYFFTLVILFAFTKYISNICMREGWYDSPPKRLRACVIILGIGAALLIIAHFTGLYYTFDEHNVYHRAPGFMICYIAPTVVIVILLSIIFQNFGKMRRIIRIALTFFIIAPICAAGLQIANPLISFNNLSLVFFGIFLFSFDLVDMNDQIEKAHQHEIESTQASEREARRLFEQTASALANAIDEKDTYTQGHSTRVATYSRLIAQRAGKDETICDEVYYAGLLHDVGKIGIPDYIINKTDRLTDEENEIMKTHPERGDRILASIVESPYLCEGARHHHERYDGCGYPDGLAGEEIPGIARIIAVADAYDAMSSKRSYRDTMPQETVRGQIEQGLGTQFDPRYGSIMLELIDEDESYQMREPE